MKNVAAAIGIALIAIATFLVAYGPARAQQASPLIITGGGDKYVKPVNNLWGLQWPGLATSTSGCLSINSSGWISPSGSACGGGGGGTFPFIVTSHFGTTTSATSTPLFLRGNLFSLFASSTSVFDRASTTQLTLGSDFLTDFSGDFAISSAGVVTIADDSHAHTGTTLSGIDISDDTNLAGDAEIVLTGDTLSIAASIARDTELHSAVTLAGEDYLSLSGQQITANAIDPDNLSASDFGSFTCNGSACTIDNGAVSNTMLANSSVSYGGVTLSLGGTDATPAFDLTDATNLPIVAGTTGTLTLARGGTGTTTGRYGGLYYNDGNGVMRQASTSADIQYDPSFPKFTTRYASTTALTISGNAYVGSLSGVLIGTSGAVSAGVDGTDYTLTNAITCTNQAITAVTAAGVSTCSSINNAYWSGTDLSVANGGTGLSTFGGTNHILYTTAADTLSSEAAFTYTAGSDLLTVVNAAVSGSLVIPQGTAPTVDAAGEIGYDSTDFQLLVATSTNASYPGVIPVKQRLWGATIASSSVDLVSGGRIWLPPQRDGFTVKEIHCAVDGGTSIVVNLSNSGGTTDSETLTCDADGAQDTDIGTNNLYSAGSLNSLEIGTVTGAVDYLTIAIYGVYTRE